MDQIVRAIGAAALVAFGCPGGALAADLEMRDVSSFSVLGRTGTYPDGASGISMATTICNGGEASAPWQAPMAEAHPVIVMSMYRLSSSGALDQIGTSWARHGFFALASDACGYGCASGSDGTELPPGCSTSNGVGTNGERFLLGPRDEIDPFLGTWTCEGSYFSGFRPDCVRREDGSGVDPVAHRCEVRDADLLDPDATYYLDAYVVTAGDDERGDNVAHHAVTPIWTGSSWSLVPNGATVEGLVTETWGDIQRAGSASDDGEFVLSANVEDLGDGTYRYDYVVTNRDSWRNARRLVVPIGGASVSDVRFHDWDADDGSAPDGNDWRADTSSPGNVIWEAVLANPILFGYTFSFGFVSDAAPGIVEAEITLDEPGDGSSIRLETLSPSPVVDVAPVASTEPVRVRAVRPIPFASGSLRIDLDVTGTHAATASIHDVRGREVVRLLENGALSATTSLVWDGRDAAGRAVATGTYFLRLTGAGWKVEQRIPVLR